MGIRNDVEQRRIVERLDWGLVSACEGKICIQNHPPKNRCTERVFSMLRRLTFPARSATFVLYLVEVRIPLVAGVLFRSASDARAKGASAVDPPKSLRQLNAGRLGARAKTCPLSSVVKLCGWSAIEE